MPRTFFSRVFGFLRGECLRGKQTDFASLEICACRRSRRGQRDGVGIDLGHGLGQGRKRNLPPPPTVSDSESTLQYYPCLIRRKRREICNKSRVAAPRRRDL